MFGVPLPDAPVASTRRLAAAPRAPLGVALALALSAVTAAAQGRDRLIVSTLEEGRSELVAIDPESGSTEVIAGRDDESFTGVVQEPSGDLIVISRGRVPRTGRVLRYSFEREAFQVLSDGGFFVDPIHAALAPSGWIYVIDGRAVGGEGALLRVDPRSGEQELVAFGPSLRRPHDLVFSATGKLYVLGRALLQVDPELGTVLRQVPLPFSLRDPTSLSIDDRGRLLIADRGLRGASPGLLLRVEPESGDYEVLASSPLEFVGLEPLEGDVVVFAQQGPQPDLLGIVAPGQEPVLLAAGPNLVGTRALSWGGFGPGSAPSAFSDEPPAARYLAPARPELPAMSIEVHPDHVRLLHGPGAADDEVLPGGTYPLATALRAATPGSDPVLGIYGDIPGSLVSIGAGHADSKDYVAHWGPVPMRFALVGMTPDARLREFSVWQRMNDGTVHGGVVDVIVKDLTIEARYSSGFSTPKTHNFGLVRFYDCHFAAGRESKAAGAYSGFGYKWGVRSHGRGRFDFRNCTFDPVQEHCVYVDSPQGDSIFQSLRHRGSTRTAVQVVNRSIDNPGLSGYGTLLFEDIHVYDLWGDGGSGITVAGHLGDVVFRNIRARERAASGGSHGGLVVWTDNGPGKGAYLYRGEDGGLYSTGSVTLESCDFDLPNADRPQVAISGAERVRIDSFLIRGSRAAFSFDSTFGKAVIHGPAVVDGVLTDLTGAPIENGRIRFGPPCPLSAFVGFGSDTKVLLEDRALTDGEINSQWCP